MSVFFPPGSPGDHSATTPARAKRFRWLRRVLAVFAVLVVVSVAASTIYAGSVSDNFTHNLLRKALLPPTAPMTPGRVDLSEAPRPAKSKTDAIDYVLMGSDSRSPGDAGAGRSDTLMVLHLAGDRKSAYLISFPRDMYVSIPGRGKNKINAAFAFGGPQLTVRTLEGLLDTRMDHVALIDFDGFIRLSDELGGITVNNPHASSSRGYDFPAGEITISGDRALAYVRERYSLPNGDLDRAARQRTVVKAILQKGLSRDMLTSPARLTSFVGGVARHLTIDEELSDSEIRRTALSMRLTGNDVKSLQAPISGFGTVRGQSIDVVDQAKLKALATALKTDQMDAYVRAHPNN